MAAQNDIERMQSATAGLFTGMTAKQQEKQPESENLPGQKNFEDYPEVMPDQTAGQTEKTGKAKKPTTKAAKTEKPKPKTKEEDMPVSIWLDKQTKKKLKALSHATRSSVSSIVKAAVQWYIHDYKLSVDEKIVYDAILRIMDKEEG